MDQVLSLCIPTWNRAKLLETSLESLLDQFQDKAVYDEVELIISDNASTDETKSVVDNFLEKGLPIHYSRNQENVGADRNFIKCMQLATGKYVFLLGDDDILKPESLSFIINLLKNNDFGLVHFYFKDKEDGVIVYEDKEEYMKAISYWYTFMSGNIFRREVVDLLNAEKYIGSYLLQMPFYIKSTLMGKDNVLVYKSLIDGGLDSEGNGGYNFYQVFVQNYLSIWKEFLQDGHITLQTYDYIRRDIYQTFIMRYNRKFLVRRDGISRYGKLLSDGRKGFSINGVWRILFLHYGSQLYFYKSLLRMIYWRICYVGGIILKRHS